MLGLFSACSQESQPGSSDRRAAYREACGKDIETYCASATSREERRACVRENKDKFSDGCKTYMEEHPWRGRGQGEGKPE